MEERLLAIYKQLSNVWNPTAIFVSQIEKRAEFTSRIWQDYTRASANGNRGKGAKFEQYERTITKRVYYSPHHAVVRKDRETAKVRIVYDGSAKNSKEERSLNDCLEVGGNHVPHIFDMLTKFRWNTVGLTADIEKAFFNGGHQTRR